MNLQEFKDKLNEMAALAIKMSEECYENNDDQLAGGWWHISKATTQVANQIEP